MALSGSRGLFAKLQCVIVRREGLQGGPGLVLEGVNLGRAATHPNNQGFGFSQWRAEPAAQGSRRLDDRPPGFEQGSSREFVCVRDEGVDRLPDSRPRLRRGGPRDEARAGRPAVVGPEDTDDARLLV
nr:hypothetical protein GCM10025730_49480 [Promicromonospora thailandica]